MAMRHVYDDSNPFAPELKAKRKNIEETTTIHRMKMQLQAMDAYSRHKQLINNYLLFHQGSTSKLQRETSNDKNDYDIIRENHRFLWEGKDLSEAEINWEKGLAKKYYDKLFKEYCIADLSHYKHNRIAMRWRVEREMFTGKGQFECGSKHCCSREELSSWEVNFAYVEEGEKKNALVKLRLCAECSQKLNYNSKKRLIKKERKVERDRSPKERHGKGHKKRRMGGEGSPSNLHIPELKGGVEAETATLEAQQPGSSRLDAGQKPGSSTENERTKAGEIWSRKTAVETAEKTLDDEFEEFIDDLLL